jgi:hypothetical protein
MQMTMNPAFERHIGIDYSGAETPQFETQGSSVYEAHRLNQSRDGDEEIHHPTAAR